jgi:hypothetical protein
MPGPFANVRTRTQPAGGQPAGVDPVEHDKLRRQLAEVQAQLAQAKADLGKRDDAHRALSSDRDRLIRDAFIEREAAKHRALNATHITRLLGDDFEVVIDDKGKPKVQVRGKPDVDPSAHLAEWFKSEGSPYTAPTVPPGAGASQQSGTAPQVPPLDLKTSQGATSFVQSLTGVAKPPAQ